MRIHLPDGQRNKYGNYSAPHFRKLENSHGFVFSSQCKRELEDFPEKVKEDRLARANEALQAGIDRENMGLLGKQVSVLIEGLDKKKRYYTGRTPQWKIVHVLNAGDACNGKIIDVEITERYSSNLRGYYVGAARVRRHGELP